MLTASFSGTGQPGGLWRDIPGRRGLNGERAHGTAGQAPRQRRGATSETALRLTSRRFCRDATSAGHGAERGGDSAGGVCKPALASGWTPAARRPAAGPGGDSEAGSVRSMTADRTPGSGFYGTGEAAQPHQYQLELELELEHENPIQDIDAAQTKSATHSLFRQTLDLYITAKREWRDSATLAVPQAPRGFRRADRRPPPPELLPAYD